MAVSNQSQLERDLFNMTRPKSVKKDPKRIRLTVREKLCILDRLGKGEKQYIVFHLYRENVNELQI